MTNISLGWVNLEDNWQMPGKASRNLEIFVWNSSLIWLMKSFLESVRLHDIQSMIFTDGEISNFYHAWTAFIHTFFTNFLSGSYSYNQAICGVDLERLLQQFHRVYGYDIINIMLSQWVLRNPCLSCSCPFQQLVQGHALWKPGFQCLKRHRSTVWYWFLLKCHHFRCPFQVYFQNFVFRLGNFNLCKFFNNLSLSTHFQLWTTNIAVFCSVSFVLCNLTVVLEYHCSHSLVCVKC